MSFLKSILKQNAVYQSNFQMSRQCLQRSDVFYLTLQRFTVSTYIGDGLQSEDFQTFLKNFQIRSMTSFPNFRATSTMPCNFLNLNLTQAVSPSFQVISFGLFTFLYLMKDSKLEYSSIGKELL